MLTCYYTFV